MSRKLLFAALIFVLLFSFAAALADDDGYDSWCNEDQYGCWVTDEDGGRCYIMFWSEEARAYFMGSHSKPGELVTDKPNTAGGRLGMDKTGIRGPVNYFDQYVELLKKYGEYDQEREDYYKNNPTFISKDVYDYAVNWYKEHAK